MNRKKVWTNKFRIGISVVLLVIILLAFVFFERGINSIISKNTVDYLKETASLYAGTFKIKLNDQLFMLESQARYFADVDMDDYNAVKATIMSTKGVGEFKRIAVANSSGMTVNYDGHSSGNILMKDYFKLAMLGISQVSSAISVDEDGEKVLTLAVPIFQQEKVAGVITGTFAYSILDDIFSVDVFGGEGYSYVIDVNGSVIIGSKSPKRLCFSDNLFDFVDENRYLDKNTLLTMRNNMKAMRTDMVESKVEDSDRILVYTPIGMNNWYVLSIITADYITAQQRRITGITFVVIGITMAAFIVFIFMLNGLLIKNEAIEKDNARYTITNESSQTLIFEYDFEQRMLEFTGNSDFLFGRNIRRLPIDEFGRVQELIHPDDANLLDDLREFVRGGGTSYNSEIRMKGSGSTDYIWYRIAGSVVLGKESEPLKFIGNVVNVNSQVLHEKELKDMAETDLLSGLLNKVFMEKSVTKFLQKPEGSTGVLYIIDLDNFKQVNDRLGHSMGDNAICNAATVLSLVFSEKDFIGRIGGDEFCVFLCLPQGVTSPESIMKEKAKTLCSLLAEEYHNGDVEVHVTSSIGMAVFPEDGETYKDLFRKADIALYHVKNSGKNNFAVYDDSMVQKGESVYE